MSSSSDFVPRCLKFSIFFMNFLYWVLGLFSVGVGLHVHVDLIQPIQELISNTVNPAFIFIALGTVLFIVTTVGCVGTIRENICLLRTYIIVLLLLLMGHLATGVIFFIVLFSDNPINEDAEDRLRTSLINYREDEKAADYMNFVQATVQCCGIGSLGYKDWSLNSYFQCTDSNISPERCNVPPSCCNFNGDEMINLMCGQGVINDTISKKDAAAIIYTTGCLVKIEEILQSTAVVLGVVAFGVTVPLLCGLMLATRMVNSLQIKVNNYYKRYYTSNGSSMIHFIPNGTLYHTTEPTTTNIYKR